MYAYGQQTDALPLMLQNLRQLKQIDVNRSNGINSTTFNISSFQSNPRLPTTSGGARNQKQSGARDQPALIPPYMKNQHSPENHKEEVDIDSDEQLVNRSDLDDGDEDGQARK